jgi:hypothetical protein
MIGQVLRDPSNFYFRVFGFEAMPRDEPVRSRRAPI